MLGWLGLALDVDLEGRDFCSYTALLAVVSFFGRPETDLLPQKAGLLLKCGANCLAVEDERLNMVLHTAFLASVYVLRRPYWEELEELLVVLVQGGGCGGEKWGWV